MAKPALTVYRTKRDFTKTEEPSGEHRVAPSSRLRFVVQKHAATRLHYDLRLEWDGVFKSWAVTGGPHRNPDDKRLAVEVEDHPLDYGDFEGTIPKGQYGGGTVQLWDRGTWTSQTDDPDGDLKRGSLKIVMDGERMHGKWALIRMRDRDEGQVRRVRHNWLLMKEVDDEAKRGTAGDALVKDVTSVKTGRTLDEIAAKPTKV